MSGQDAKTHAELCTIEEEEEEQENTRDNQLGVLPLARVEQSRAVTTAAAQTSLCLRTATMLYTATDYGYE